MNRCRALESIVILIASAGCDSASAPPASVVRDSAGVRIVENVEPRWTAEAAWWLSQEPVTQIGGIEGDPNQELYQVRGAIRLTDGNIIVVSAGTNELRFFRPDGSHIRTVGGQGDGPGEFRFVSWVSQLDGDSLAAFDGRQLRVSYFDPDGGFVRSMPLRTSDEVPFLQAIVIFGDGSFLVMAPTVPRHQDQTGCTDPPIAFSVTPLTATISTASDGAQGESRSPTASAPGR